MTESIPAADDGNSSNEQPTIEENSDTQESESSASHQRGLQLVLAPEIALRFASCGRCSLFLASYRLQHDPEFLKAIDEIDAGWLTLPWNPDLRDLVQKSFGCAIDGQSYFFESTCPECQRSFSYAEPDPEQSAWFLIKM